MNEIQDENRRTAKGGHRMTPEEALIVDRLKATYGDVEEMEKVFDIVVHTLALREAELSVAKALCTRAADALKSEHEGRPVLADKHPLGCSICNLIAELRKAAQ